jgi:hypothetical protein
MRRTLVALVLSATIASLAACSAAPTAPGPAGGLVGQMSGTSDVAGQQGDPALGGRLAVIPIAAMDGPFWTLTEEDPILDPQEWAHVAVRLSEDDVTELGGTTAVIDADGAFRLEIPPAEYAVCYQPGDARITGCDAIALPASGAVEATWGEAGFHIAVAD